MFGMKAEIAVREKGLDFDLVTVAYDPARGYEPKDSEVLRVNPKRQVPVLFDGAVEVFDSTQIFEYLEELAPSPALWPPGRAAKTEARLLELKSDEVFFPHVIKLMDLQDAPDDPAAFAARQAIAAYYSVTDARLAGQPCLGAAYSYADIAFYMAQVFAERMGAPMGADPHLRAWRERMGDRPPVAVVMTRLAAYLKDNRRTVPDFLARFAAR